MRAMVQLRGITWNHTRGFAPLAATAQAFADQHPGVDITWDRRSLWAFGEQPLETLVSAYDLLVIDHPMIGWAATTGALVAFDDQPPHDVTGRLQHQYVGASAESYQYDGHEFAFALDAACQVAAARMDLLERAGEPPPRTWEAVLDLARRTRRVALPLNPIDALSALLTLCAHLGAPAGQHGDGFLHEEVTAEAIRLLRDLACLVDERCHDANPIAVLNRMSRTDEILYCPLVFGYTNYSRAGYAPRALTFTDIPCQGGDVPAGSCLGGAGLAVSASSPHIDIAVAYARWVTDPETQRTEYVRAGGQPAATAAWEDPTANELTRHFFTDTRATIEAAYLRPRHPGFPAFQTDVAPLVRQAVLGSLSPVELIETVNQRYAESLAWRPGPLSGPPAAHTPTPDVRPTPPHHNDSSGRTTREEP